MADPKKKPFIEVDFNDPPEEQTESDEDSNSDVFIEQEDPVVAVGTRIAPRPPLRSARAR
jgi:hypothetical protein